jgi:hypothetical protein
MDHTKPVKVTINEPPAVPPAPGDVAGGPEILIDSKGRKIKLRELTLLEEQDVIAAMPPNHSAQSLVLGRSLMAARVASIDGVDCFIPISTIQYRAMLGHIGKEGLAAVIESLPKPAADGEPNAVDLAKN